MTIQDLAMDEAEKSKGNLQIQHPYNNMKITECVFSF